MGDQFWIFVVIIVVVNIVKSVSRRRRSSGHATSSRSGGHGSSRRWDPVDLPPDGAGPQAEPPAGGWPLGITPDRLAAFATLGAPGGRVGPVTARVGGFPLAGDPVEVELALFPWTWPHRDDGRWETKELPVALVRVPGRMPDLRLRRPGRPPSWQGIVAMPGRFRVDWAYDIPRDDPRFAPLFTPEFVRTMATTFDHLVFEAIGDLLVVAPHEPRTTPDPGVHRSPPRRLVTGVATTADELPTLAEQVARLLVTMPDGWWDQVLVDDVAPPRPARVGTSPATGGVPTPPPPAPEVHTAEPSWPDADPDAELDAGLGGDSSAEPVWPEREPDGRGRP